jgi:hypothetical protein
MAQDVLVIPPIRQSIEDIKSAQNGDTPPLTEKSWYLYWDQLGKAANRQGWMITYGTHADRPSPDVMPDGAIYVETDRGAIYQKISGFWVYLAGTMWATVNPDQRPTDLGPQDANFEFRGTDQARQFFWTGSKWVEATLVRYGTHAQRLALTLANVGDSELFVEWDRKYVIYQLQGGVWHYIAGTMWGTYTPDQRPTDLGANDAGFDFRGTDVVRQSLWSGTAWVDPGTLGDPTTTKGDLIVRSSTAIDRLPVGPDTDVLTADSTQPLGVKWAPAPTGGGGTGAVTSVFGRTGAVLAQAGDYAAYEVTNAVDQSSSYTNPAWILSLPYSKITGAPATTVTSFKTRTGAVVPATGDYTAAQVTGAVSGAGTLTTVGSIPKVTAAGVLGPSVMTEATGNIGIGTAAPSFPLSLGTGVGNKIALYDGTGVDYGFGIQSNVLQIFTPTVSTRVGIGYGTSTAFTETLSIAGGAVGIGMTNPAYVLQLAADSAAKPGTSTWTVASDGRLKRNVKDLAGGLEIIERLHPVEGEYNGMDGTPEGHRVVSFLAEEIREILPGCVSSHRGKLRETDAGETDILDFNIHEVLMHVVLAVQQLARQVAQLETQKT